MIYFAKLSTWRDPMKERIKELRDEIAEISKANKSTCTAVNTAHL
jgi:hypothetical protein